MHPDVNYAVQKSCDIDPTLSMFGRDLLPQIRGRMRPDARRSWTCTAIGLELAKFYKVTPFNGGQLFHGLAATRNRTKP